MDGGEEVIEYMVGPRGKVEVGESGVAGLVREVYGRPDPTMTVPENEQEKEENEEFESRLERNLASSRRDGGTGRVVDARDHANDEPPPDEGGRGSRRNQTNRRNTRGRAAAHDGLMEEDDDE
jgi:hypothetical protein